MAFDQSSFDAASSASNSARSLEKRIRVLEDILLAAAKIYKIPTITKKIKEARKE